MSIESIDLETKFRELSICRAQWVVGSSMFVAFLVIIDTLCSIGSIALVESGVLQSVVELGRFG